MFESLITLLDTFEQGMADKTLTRKSEIIRLLTSMQNQVQIILGKANQRLPQGSKSTLRRIGRLAGDLISGINATEISPKELRQITRDNMGVLNAALTKLNSGEDLNASQKAQVAEHESDEDKAGEIRKLIEGYDWGSGLVDREKLSADQINEYLTEFLNGFSLSELRAVDESQLNKLELSEIVNAVRAERGESRYLPNGKLVVTDSAGPANSLRRSLVVQHDAEVEILSKSYGELQSRIPSDLNGKPFAAISYPVVPLFDDIAAMQNPAKLKAAGFKKVTQVGDHFIVLENQYLLVIDSVKLGVKSLFRDATLDGKSHRVLNKSQGARIRGEIGEALKGVMERINEASPVKYAIASNVVVRNPNNGNLSLVWIIPEHTRKALEHGLRTTQVAWDIPRKHIAARSTLAKKAAE